MRAHPGGFAMMAIALEEQLSPPRTLVLRGAPAPLRAWRAELAREAIPDTAILAVPDGAAGIPAVLDKPPRPGPVTAWLCRGASCLEPIGELAQLKSALRDEWRGG
jgi:uncharacterized protein YyaL (SSP411 family)